jgi:hypothetical protein
MASYQKIVQLRPEVREFVRYRRSIRHRGDVQSYGPNIRSECFSTDAAGFRHSTAGNKSLSVAECLSGDRYGLVLGASNIFGFGVAGNENTIPSLLAERFGFAFANVGMPGGNSRNLYSLLLGFLARTPRKPAVVVHFSGGDCSTFCVSSMADPVFGSPNRNQLPLALKERGGYPNAQAQLPNMLAFSSLWTSTIANFCRANKVQLVLGHDTTFFDKKSKPNAIEIGSGLGSPRHPHHTLQFANHRLANNPFYERRKTLAGNHSAPLAGWGPHEKLTFIDEFHYDRESTRVVADAVAKEIEPLL